MAHDNKTAPDAPDPKDPLKPTLDPDELSDDDLDKVSGGMSNAMAAARPTTKDPLL